MSAPSGHQIVTVELRRMLAETAPRKRRLRRAAPAG